MLILERQIGEKVILKTKDDQIITVMVTALRGQKIVLGFDAPDSVDVWRGEIYERIQEAIEINKNST